MINYHALNLDNTATGFWTDGAAKDVRIGGEDPTGEQRPPNKPASNNTADYEWFSYLDKGFVSQYRSVNTRK